MDESLYTLGFSLFPGVGPKRYRELLRVCGSASVAWNADEKTLLSVLGISYTKQFLSFRSSFSFSSYNDLLAAKKVWFLALGSEAYPPLLTELSTSPIVLYGLGSQELVSTLNTKQSVGVVGTRKVTGYGKQVTEMITSRLVSADCVIVSGLAMGVDAVAHRTTLQEHGLTIAVLGSGVDVCHPSVNRGIYDQIILHNGAVVSEYPLGEAPSKGSFPSRNRIIAGLSKAVVMTEGSADSGALYTARDALAAGRLVFAVPGQITSPLSDGPNGLLALGAKLATSGDDILKELGLVGKVNVSKSIRGETADEQTIIDLLRRETLLFDEVVRQTGFDTRKTSSLLSTMELRGIIRNTDEGYCVLA